MNREHRHVKQFLVVVALVVLGPAPAAGAQVRAHEPSRSTPASDVSSHLSHTAEPAAGTAPDPGRENQVRDGGSSVRLETVEPELTAADRDLLVKVRLAGLWEMTAGQLALKKGTAPRVREIGRMIAGQHAQLDALVVAAAKELDVSLPDGPNAEQRRWLDELDEAQGPQFDELFVHRLRAAHGKVFPLIAVVRAGTENSTVREFAQKANGFVLTHLTLLESTGLVRYEELPRPAVPATGPIAAASRRSAAGGIAVPVIWLILAAALVSGVIATTRMIRPRSFGGRHTGRPRAPEEPDDRAAATGPAPVRHPARLSTSSFR